MSISRKTVIYSIVIGVCALFVLISPLAHAQVQDCVRSWGCVDPGLFEAAQLENRGIAYPLVAITGLIDGFNPCAIGLMLLFAGSIIYVIRRPERMLRIGIVYVATIFLTNLLVGIFFSRFVYGLVSVSWYGTATLYLKYIIVGFVWVAALVHIKDVFRPGRGFGQTITKTQAWKVLKKLVRLDWHTIIPLGILVALFELPCSLPLYLGSITIMIQAFSELRTIEYLFVYNLLFVLPLIIIFAIVMQTHHLFKSRDVYHHSLKWMHLLMGIAQIAIGVGLLLI
jgi:cytochrome c biogenesis protein CcdA